MKLPAWSTSLVLGDQAVVSGSQFLTTVVLVRALGLEAFGVFSLLWLAVMLALGLQQALVSQPVMAIAPKKDRDDYLASAAVIQFLFSTGLALVGLVIFGLAINHWDGENLRNTLVPMLLALVLRQQHAFVRTGFFVRGKRVDALVNDMIAYPGQVALLLLWSTITPLSIAGALWAVAIANGVAVVLGMFRLGRWNFNKDQLATNADRHWFIGRWMAAMQGMQFFASNSFLVAAAALLGTGAVGAVKAAQTVMGVLNLLHLAMENVVPMRAAREYVSGGVAGMRRYIRWIGVRGIVACGVVTSILAAMPEIVLTPLYGAQVTPELVLALRALALLCMFSFLIALLQIAFRSLERTRPVFLCYLINTLVAVTIAEPIVRTYGFTGAVFGLVAQQALMAGLLFLAFGWVDRRARRLVVA